jgi:hypothetical protein
MKWDIIFLFCAVILCEMYILFTSWSFFIIIRCNAALSYVFILNKTYIYIPFHPSTYHLSLFSITNAPPATLYSQTRFWWDKHSRDLGINGKIICNSTILWREGARGSIVVWGTMLQAGRSRVRFPMRSLDFSIDITLIALYPSLMQRVLTGS